jgi:hypothetical protein
MACPRCHTPFDAEKALAAKIRNEKGYRERLSETERKRMKVSRTGYIDGKMAGINKQLDAYLNKHPGIKTSFNGLDTGEIQERKSYYPRKKKKDRSE